MGTNGTTPNTAHNRGKTVNEIDPNIDFWDMEAFANQKHHDWFKTLRSEGSGVQWYDESKSQVGNERQGQGFWSISTHGPLREVNRDAELFSSNIGGTQMQEPIEENRVANDSLMISMDLPKHTRYRKLVNRGFTPKMIRLLSAYLENRTRIIVDQVSEKGSADFVTQLSAELPLQAIAELVGIPVEERSKIFEWSNRLIGADDPEYAGSPELVAEAGIELYTFAQKLVEARKKDPRDDIITKLLESDVDGEKLTEDEFNAFFLLLCVAGNETTRNSITWGMKAFMENRDQWEKFCSDPDAYLDTATEEIVRWATPVMMFRRTATADCELAGKQIQKGDKLVMWHISANRDEKIFDDPYKFDIERSPNDHIGFGGGGPHFCLGASLARMEIRLVFKEIATRLPDMELAGDARFLISNFIGGIKELPVKFSPTPSTNTAQIDMEHPQIPAIN